MRYVIAVAVALSSCSPGPDEPAGPLSIASPPPVLDLRVARDALESQPDLAFPPDFAAPVDLSLTPPDLRTPAPDLYRTGLGPFAACEWDYQCEGGECQGDKWNDAGERDVGQCCRPRGIRCNDPPELVTCCPGTRCVLLQGSNVMWCR